MKSFLSPLLFDPVERIVVAVSGGVDSMVLLSSLLMIHPREQIIVAHFDHSLRGRESDEDRAFVQAYCRERGILCEIEKMDITSLAHEEKMSIESVARKYRYQFLRDIAKKYSSQKILTAHHLDDRIETMFFNLIRGSKLGGIHALSPTSSFPSSSDHGLGVDSDRVTLLRPLLAVTKSAIIHFAESHNIPYREDSTNTDTQYLRNHIRKNILPLCEQINPHYRLAFENFIEYTTDLHHWIDGQLVHWLEQEKMKLFAKRNGSEKGKDWDYVFSCIQFSKEELFFQKEIIRFLYESSHDGTVGLSDGLIDELLRFITQGSNTYGVRTIRSLLIERRGDLIRMRRVK